MFSKEVLYRWKIESSEDTPQKIKQNCTYGSMFMEGFVNNWTFLADCFVWNNF